MEKKVKLQDNNNNKKYRQWCRSRADSAREPASMGSIFTAGFGILLLLLRTNWILRSLNKMIEDKEMKEILDKMKKEDEGEEESDVGSGNNDDFVGLKERSHVPADSETSAAPADPSSKERAEGLKREEMKCSQLGYFCGPMLIVMVVEMRKRKTRKNEEEEDKEEKEEGKDGEVNGGE